jgi:hypothetical protein
MRYISVATGNLLDRRENQFYWKGRYFPGLVDVKANGLYDDPDDSFNAHVSIPTSIEQGLIKAEEPKQ